jgi:SAM-dependent methyltransferase
MLAVGLKDPTSGAKRVLDVGCGEAKLIRELLKEKQFEEIVGLDVSIRSLEVAQRRLKLERLPTKQAERVRLMHGSLMYRDKRLDGFDAAAVVEVVEHLDPPRLAAAGTLFCEWRYGFGGQEIKTKPPHGIGGPFLLYPPSLQSTLPAKSAEKRQRLNLTQSDGIPIRQQ